MKKILISLIAAVAALSGCASVDNASAQKAPKHYDVCAIVWPAYHPAPRWKELGIFDHNNGEWQNVYEAKPKYPGHNQPKVPLWGYEHEDNPIAVARKIDAALAAGINIFMYDWYWYGNRPFLENALNNGFLKAPNNERMRFFIMWANHDVTSLWNNKSDDRGVIWNADVSYDEFTKVLVPRFIAYFKKPNYYKIEGKPVFGLYLLRTMVRGMGGAENAKKAFEFFRAEVKKAGFPDIFVMSNTTSYKGFKFEIEGDKKPSPEKVLKYFGIDAVSLYNWTGSRNGTYTKWRDLNIPTWDKFKEEAGIFFPTVSTGWDTTPRYIKYTPDVKERSPLEYEKALRAAAAWDDKNLPEGMPKLIMINAWNEWTEGEYLEPDSEFGYGFLNATARVFGPNAE
ncbi:MAG: glycoside hydrolase family 99-like domain-containing protein [Christensenellales bacterium]